MEMVGDMDMVKNKIYFKSSLKKLIITLLIVLAIPIPVNSESQIPRRKDCSLLKKKQSYDYYDRQEAHDFGRKIQTLLAKKDLEGLSLIHI